MKPFIFAAALIFFTSIAYALPEGFVYLNEVEASIVQDMRYAGDHNFIGRPIKGYEAKTCILTQQAALALANVQQELLKMSLSLKVYDCYRPTQAVADFMTWSKEAAHQEMKQEFYPRVNKQDVFRLGYVAEKSGHSRGSTVDLTLVPIPSPVQAAYKAGQPLVSCIASYQHRFRDNSIDMGTGYDCLDELASPMNPEVNSDVWHHRMLLRRVMLQNGFKPYEKEWWHFTLDNEPYPDTWFNFTVNDSPSATVNFIALSDIHFDPYLSCGKARTCPLIERLRHSPSTQWPPLFAKYDVKPPQFYEDTNFTLLTASLSAVKQAAQANHAQFVLLLGDLLGHEFCEQYKRYSGDQTMTGCQAFSRKTLEFLTAQLSQAFPAIDVYVAAGNNDSYSGDYATRVNGAFFMDAAKLWSGLIKNSANRLTMRQQFQHAGYYSVMLPAMGNVRLIVLNTNLFSYKGTGRNLDHYATEELNWLHSELEAAKSNHQRVLIALHIPEGIDIYATLRIRLFRIMTLWKSQYIRQFQAELRQYAPEIVGMFAGHLHTDWYHIMTFENANEIPMTGVTSISPIFGNPPGFKVCTYAIHSSHLDECMTHSYPNLHF